MTVDLVDLSTRHARAARAARRNPADPASAADLAAAREDLAVGRAIVALGGVPLSARGRQTLLDALDAGNRP